MFPFQLLFVLAADTLAARLDAWAPRRIATAHAAAVGVAVISERGGLEWYHGVENVLTRRPVGDETSWPIRAFSTPGSVVASPHSPLGAALLPGLIVLGVWGTLAWVLLIPVSAVTRRQWRLGRWHEVLAVFLAVPVTWLFLRRMAGPVMATYFTAIAAALCLLPIGLAAVAWRKSRLAAIALVAVVALVTWKAERLPVPLPSGFDGRSSEGATLLDLQRAALRALRADSLGRISMGFGLDHGRWIAHDRSRGAEALLVLLPARELGVVAVSNTGETTALLEEIIDSIAR